MINFLSIKLIHLNILIHSLLNLDNLYYQSIPQNNFQSLRFILKLNIILSHLIYYSYYLIPILVNFNHAYFTNLLIYSFCNFNWINLEYYLFLFFIDFIN